MFYLLKREKLVAATVATAMVAPIERDNQGGYPHETVY